MRAVCYVCFGLVYSGQEKGARMAASEERERGCKHESRGTQTGGERRKLPRNATEKERN